MKLKAFISGPILGMENEQSYRETITRICNKLGIEVIDPWLREKIIYNKEDPCWWKDVPASGFVQRDLEDADSCDVMVVYLPKLSAGACMELFYAKQKGKKVIVVSEMSCLSPWIEIHADAIVKNFDQLGAELQKMKPNK